MSTIAKHQILAPGSAEARSLGATLRTLRLKRGLSQGAVGASFTRAYVSAVEGGHVVPSLASLIILARRLEVTPGEVLDDAGLATGPVMVQGQRPHKHRVPSKVTLAGA